MKRNIKNSVMALLMVLCMVLGLAQNTMAAGPTESSNKIPFQKVDETVDLSQILPERMLPGFVDNIANQEEQDYEVRVFIVLSKTGVIDSGFSTLKVAESTEAAKMSAKMVDKQEALAKKISKEALGGEKLQVRYNYTLFTNAISAVVMYSDIEKIEKVRGVESVEIVPVYVLQKEDEVAGPNMAVAGPQVGANVAWEAGYTGKGQRIGVIDTGIAVGHPSFDEAAFLYGRGGTDELFTLDKIATVWDRLHASSFITEENGYDMMDAYLSAKIPFAVNYVDEDLDVSHENDDEGDHGTHVSGIATANKYVPVAGGGFAEQDEKVCGVAPDAQLFTFKVFGKNGGAYTDDYMAAIEDAILLGVDVVNLSLGSGNAGNTSSAYEDVMDGLLHSDTVASISAGNAGRWFDKGYYSGLFKFDTNMDTCGSPGSYTNSFTVASIDEIGSTESRFEAKNGETSIGFIANSDSGPTYGHRSFESLDTLGTGTTYDCVVFSGIGDADTFAQADVTGKIVFVSRGTTSFYQKVDAAEEAGAIGCIIYNNAAGNLGLNLTGSESTIPCVGITQADANIVKAGSTEVKEGVYTCQVVVHSNAAPEMSSFSSVGVPQSLELKPEITAPGGSINSTRYTAEEGFTYGLMSGTSMAAPSVTGQIAVLMEYIKENFTDLSVGDRRKLAIEILSATAVPALQFGSEGIEVSPRNQGAGVANVGFAVKTPAYLEMRADGKIKAELGDDPSRTGIYDISFDVVNITDEAVLYDVDTSILTEELVEGTFVTNHAIRLNPIVTVNGTPVETGARITVPAQGRTSVNVKITLSSEDKDYLNQFDCGEYVDGYIYLRPVEAEQPTLSLPLMAFYGSWGEASMFDPSIYTDLFTEEFYLPYSQSTAEDAPISFTNYFITTILGEEAAYAGNMFIGSRTVNANEYEYDYRNNTVSDPSEITGLHYTLIRNAARTYAVIMNADTQDIYYCKPCGSEFAEYYSDSRGMWMNTGSDIAFDWNVEEVLPEGTKLDYMFIAIPEYYDDINIEAPEDLLQFLEVGYEGLAISLEVTIDCTAPVISDVTANPGEASVSTNSLVDVTVDGDTAALFVLDSNKINAYSSVYISGNTIKTATVEVPKKVVYLLAVDYSGNQSLYRLNNSGKADTDVIESLDVLVDGEPIGDMTLVKGQEIELDLLFSPEELNEAVATVEWGSTDDEVAFVDAYNVLTAVGPGTATICVSSNALNVSGNTLTQSFNVNVIAPDAYMTGIIGDAEGKWSLTKFRATDLVNYEIVSEYLARTYDTATYLGDGLIFALVNEESYSTAYIIDLEDYSESYIGTIDAPLFDITYSETTGYIYGTYNGYIALADLEELIFEGETSAQGINVGPYLSGIASVGFNIVTYIEKLFVTTVDGRLIMVDINFRTGGSTKTVLVNGLPAAADVVYNSLIFDPVTKYVFYSVCDEVVSRMMFIDPNTGVVAELGRTENKVWPVGGLMFTEGQGVFFIDGTEGTGIIGPTPATERGTQYGPNPTPGPTPDPGPEPIVILPDPGQTPAPGGQDNPGTGENQPGETVVVNDGKNTAVVETKKNEAGETVTEATTTAAGEKTKEGLAATISGALIKSIAETDKNATITVNVTNANGVKAYSVTANVADLQPGNTLFVLIEKENGQRVLVNANEYVVGANGDIDVAFGKKANYVLVNGEEAKKLTNEILDSIKPKKSTMTVKKGKKTSLGLAAGVDKDNIESIEYSTKDTKVCKVTKSGKVTAKKAGTATINVKVTLKNGAVKKFTRTIKVK